MILEQLAELKAGTDALKAGNEALQENLVRQEARHHEELVTLRKEFESRLTAYKKAASSLEVTTADTEG